MDNTQTQGSDELKGEGEDGVPLKKRNNIPKAAGLIIVARRDDRASVRGRAESILDECNLM